MYCTKFVLYFTSEVCINRIAKRQDMKNANNYNSKNHDRINWFEDTKQRNPDKINNAICEHSNWTTKQTFIL